MKPKTLLNKLWQSIYQYYAVRKNVTRGKQVRLGIGSYISSPGGLTIGDHVYIGRYCTIECNGRIGSHVLIGNLVGLVGRWDREPKTGESSFTPELPIGHKDFQPVGQHHDIVIEDDVWIGYGAIVLSGVSIGRGARVSAGSLVTNNVPPYAIVAGVPARVVGRRFSPEEIAEHEKALYGVR